jgi:hypothetical protein
VLENECAAFAAEGIGDTARSAQRDAAEIERQTNPVIFRAIRFQKVNPVASAKSPQSPRAEQVDATPERHGNETRSKFSCFGVHLAVWIADQPCLMPMRV